LKEKIQQLITKEKVMLFMKGNPNFPQCGFSAQVVQILLDLGCEFGFYNILTDLEVREGIKEYSNWPTFPQLYVDGELVGGCDIIVELYRNNELSEVLAK
jgi:monothiol glutaredoxin